MTYSKILVPYDISKPADRALRQAISIAQSSKGVEIILLHVIQEIPVYPVVEHLVKSRKETKSAAIKDHIDYVYSSMKSYVTGILDEKKHRFQEPGLRIKSDVVLGKPVDKIIAYAKSEGVDLIIVGGTGLSGIGKLKALGSVSRGVLEKSPCPVMIVH